MKLIWTLTAAVLLLLCMAGTAFAEGPERVWAHITAIEALTQEHGTGYWVELYVLEGSLMGQTLQLVHTPLLHSIRSFTLRVGQKVQLSVEPMESGEFAAVILNVSRTGPLWVLFLMFLFLALFLGRRKGLAAILSLGLSALLILRWMIPEISAGRCPIVAAAGTAAVMIISGFVLISGFTRKTGAAILGTLGGTLSAALLANTFMDSMSITGYASEGVHYLIAEFDLVLNYRGLLMAGILIGTLGVVMDVSMSVTAFIFELKTQNPRMSRRMLAASGFKVGQDVLATMINTLILAYAGVSMPLFIMAATMNTEGNQLLNMEAVASELLRSLAGSIGLMVTIPLTAAIAALLAVPSRAVTQKRSRNSINVSQWRLRQP